MAKIPMRFKRITAAFDDVARARLCQSSGSEHSAVESNSVTDLSDLVDSFLQTDGNDDDDVRYKEKEGPEDRESLELEGMEPESKEILMSLISDQDTVSQAKQMIRKEMEKAYRSLGNSSSEGFKRRAMSWLRQRGLDAGLCKSRWEKTGRHPAGEYEYIDVLISKTRYIVEVSLAAEFTIARPTNPYVSLLEMLPQIVICRESELKQLVTVMCNAMRDSMKKREIHVPPWRRNGYMQSKWFRSYKRTTNTVSMSSSIKVCYGVDSLASKSSVGFEALPVVAVGKLRNFRGEVGGKNDNLHIGNLKAVFNEMA